LPTRLAIALTVESQIGREGHPNEDKGREIIGIGQVLAFRFSCVLFFFRTDFRPETT